MFSNKGVVRNYIYVDTNVISDVLKDDQLYIKFIQEYPLDQDVISFSAFSLYEISKSKKVFDLVKDKLFVTPSFVLNSAIGITKMEIEFLENGKAVNLFLLNPSAINGLFNKNALISLLENMNVQASFSWWDKNLPILLNIFSNVDKMFDNEPGSENLKLEAFVSRCTNYFLKSYFPNHFARYGGEELQVNNYPSLKMLSYVIFYKFYSDKKRKIKRSDLMDILITSTVPYVEEYISEANTIDIIKKIQLKDDFISKVKIRTYDDFTNHSK